MLHRDRNSKEFCNNTYLGSVEEYLLRTDIVDTLTREDDTSNTTDNLDIR